MFKDFKDFLLRGNVVDLAVAVVIGAAFTSIVKSLVSDFVTPLIAAIGGKPNFGALYFTLNHAKFMYGDFINSLISFVIVATVVFFLVVQPVNQLIKFANRHQKKADPSVDPQLAVLQEIRDELKAHSGKQ